MQSALSFPSENFHFGEALRKKAPPFVVFDKDLFTRKTKSEKEEQ